MRSPATRVLLLSTFLAFGLFLLPPIGPGTEDRLAAQDLPLPGMRTQGRTPIREAVARLKPAEGRRYRVDVLTMTPLKQIYGIWGHTSLRIHDGERGQDIIFDWGVFQFDGTFLIRFLKGSPAYLLVAQPMLGSLMFHRDIGRTMYAQEIKIDDEAAEKLLLRLAVNARPENRTYIYHHYNNNCTTKVRDIADAAAAGDIKEMFGERPANKTFRDTSNAYALNVWHWIGINLIQGTTVDQSVTAWQEMYLPVDFMDYLDEYRQAQIEAGEESIIGEKILVLKGDPPATPSGWIGVPVTVALLILLLFVLPAALPDQPVFARIGRISRGIWHGVAGFIGVVLAVFWIFTGHDSMINNVNLLAFSPLLLFAPLIARLFMGSDSHRVARLYLFFAAVPVLGILLMITALWNQPAWTFLLPSAVIQICIYVFKRREVTVV